MSLTSKIESLTVKEVHKVLEHIVEHVSEDFFYVPEGQDKSTFARISPFFRVPPWHGKWGKYFAAKDRNKYIIDFCENLRRQAKEPEAHVFGIDTLLSSLTECRVRVRGVQPGSFENDFALRAYQILKRLPSRPLELVGLPGNLDEHYFWQDKTRGKGSPAGPLGSGTWNSLRVAASLSTSSIHMALFIVISGSNTFGNNIGEYPDILAELLEASSGLASHCTSDAEYQQWYIVRAALWSSWQRGLMLYHYANLRDALERGLTGFWGREEVGQVLSYRPASRKGDEVVIWSLLAIEEAEDSPEELWRNKLRIDSESVHTGFLMSSAPRLGIKGLSWAPSTPYFKSLPEGPPTGVSSFRAFVSTETWPGTITDQGLLAAWHVYEFDTSEASQPDAQNTMLKDSQMGILKEICTLYLQDSTWGALLLPMSNVSTFEQGRETSTKYNGLIRGTLVAVLGCSCISRPSQKPAEDRGWTWKGVFEWNEKVSLPAFKEESDFLIE
ncbi:MAG: hypothetical protein ASARMPRED_004021 [Alectoria sarmentosa]|nr:MAG: hypothetical protein ASARMPRED_004021 [Alectoria sarmentosa]